MGKTDWLVNPYFIAKEYRKRGLGTLLLRQSSNLIHDTLWAVVARDNIASMKALGHAGFMTNNCVTTGWKHIPTPAPTSLLLLKFTPAH